MRVNTDQLKETAPKLKAGDEIELSGIIYTARDAAHKKFFEIIENGGELPFEIAGAAIYYAGPTDAPPNAVIGSCGPTTSGRMDKYAPKLYDLGLAATIGKGERGPEVVEAIARNRAVYLCAIGGAGALAAKCVKSCEVCAFPELGCESVKRLVVRDFPLIVAVDAEKKDIFTYFRAKYCAI